MLRPFLQQLFNLNELASQMWLETKDPELKPKTDDELEQLVEEEFPEVSLETASFVKSKIRVWRSEYNRGLWAERPTYRSFRYGEEGLPINRHSHPIDPKLVALEIVEFKEKKGFDDPRYADAKQFLQGEKSNVNSGEKEA